MIKFSLGSASLPDGRVATVVKSVYLTMDSIHRQTHAVECRNEINEIKKSSQKTAGGYKFKAKFSYRTEINMLEVKLRVRDSIRSVTL